MMLIAGNLTVLSRVGISVLCLLWSLTKLCLSPRPLSIGRLGQWCKLPTLAVGSGGSRESVRLLIPSARSWASELLIRIRLGLGS